MFKILKKKIKNKSAKIGVIGLGYVGLPLAYEFSRARFNVVGIDVNTQKIENIKKNKSYIERLSNKEIAKLNKLNFKITNEYKAVKELDIIILCLPTPINKDKSPNMKYIKDSISGISKYLNKGQLICLESTTYPGTSEELIGQKLIKKGFNIGDDFFLIYSPEREDPGNKQFKLSNTPKIVSGFSKNCKILGKEIYKNVSNSVHLVENLKIAEMSKIFENIYRSINISLVNELKLVCNKMGIDVFEVIKAAKTKPFGYSAFYPGPGLGGHCIPIDPYLFSWKARKYGIETKFIELSGLVNSKMPSFIYQNLKKHIKKINKNKSDIKILLLGASYKKNISDTRETPFIKIAEKVNKNKIKFDYHDPYVKEININKRLKLKSIKLDYKKIKIYDVIILITDHDNYKYDKLFNNAKHIIDTRGRFKTNNNVVSRS
jgi:UDP-N-acetyl-D-glucosamine dehydrogenase